MEQMQIHCTDLRALPQFTARGKRNEEKQTALCERQKANGSDYIEEDRNTLCRSILSVCEIMKWWLK